MTQQFHFYVSTQMKKWMPMACKWMFTAALFIIARKRREKLKSINWWVNFLNVLYMYNIILFSNKKNELLINGMPWMNLKVNIKLKQSQTQKITYCIFNSMHLKYLEKANLSRQKVLIRDFLGQKIEMRIRPCKWPWGVSAEWWNSLKIVSHKD